MTTYLCAVFRQKEFDPDPPPSNVFGWKISIIGLVTMLVLGIFIAYRTISLGVPVGFEDPLEQPERKGYYQEKADREAAATDSLRKQPH